MPATLSLAREAFIKGMNRDTVPVERPRLLAVLDAMIAWSVKRPDALQFRVDDNERGVVRFEQTGSHAIFWSAAPRRNDVPVLELLPAAARVLTEQERADVIATLGTHTREALDPAGRMHIGFGALKNAAACAAVLQLMGELLTKTETVTRKTVAAR